MKCLDRIVFALTSIVLGLAGCRGGGPFNSESPSVKVLVNPSSAIVAAGSTTTFSASFSPSLPQGGSLTWSVNPSSAGIITNAGVYTAAGSAGSYTIVATWTPSNPAMGTKSTGSATVEVLPVPQLGMQLNPNFIQASGANQASGTIQNGTVAGQLVPSVSATDTSGNVQTRSGFTVPVECIGPGASCP